MIGKKNIRELAKCTLCNEDAILISVGENNGVRVRRWSKCKYNQKYNPRFNCNDVCRTQTYSNPIEAINEWNNKQNVIPRKDGEGFSINIKENPYHQIVCCNCGMTHLFAFYYENGWLGIAAKQIEVREKEG